MYAFLLSCHILGITLWVGGMFFAHFALRPAVQSLEVPQRLSLMANVLKRFLNFAGLAVIVVLISGMAMLVMTGGRAVPVAWHIMAGLGIIMTLLYVHIRFAPNKRLQAAVQKQAWQEAGAALAQVRKLVMINLCLGIITILVATLMGRV